MITQDQLKSDLFIPKVGKFLRLKKNKIKLQLNRVEFDRIGGNKITYLFLF